MNFISRFVEKIKRNKEYKKLFNLKLNMFDKKVILAGTDYDRRRKLTNKDIDNIKKEHDEGKSVSYLVSKYGVSYNTIKYHLTDTLGKKEFNKKRSQYPNNSYISSIEHRNERVEYKKNLLKEGKELIIK